MAMKGKTAYFTARQNRIGNNWRIYRVVEDCPDYPGVKWLEEPASKSIAKEAALLILVALNASPGLTGYHAHS